MLQLELTRALRETCQHHVEGAEMPDAVNMGNNANVTGSVAVGRMRAIGLAGAGSANSIGLAVIGGLNSIGIVAIGGVGSRSLLPMS